MVEALIESGARITEVDNDGRIPLILAAQEGHVPVVAALLEAGSPIEARAHDGKTALRVAALEGHKDVVQYLVCHGADVNYKDADGRSSLYVLALENHVVMAEYLLDQDAEVESCDLEGRTPLHVAAWQGHYDMVELLLNNRADVNAVDNDRRTALQSAAWQGHVTIVRLLLERGADVDHTCNQGATALCIAAQEGHEDVVKVLLKFHANPNHADQYGRTATRVALKGGHVSVVKLLEEHGAQPLNGANTRRSVVSTASGSSNDGKSTMLYSGAPSLHLSGHSNRQNGHGQSQNKQKKQNTPPESPGNSYDRRKSYLSNNSKSSGNLTASNTSSTNQSSSTAGSMESPSLSFTQQLQQCSMARNRNRPLSRVLSPVSEPQSPVHSPPGSPLSEIHGSGGGGGGGAPLPRITPDKQQSPHTSGHKPGSSPRRDTAGKPVHIIANPHNDLSNNANSPVDEPVWQRISDINKQEVKRSASGQESRSSGSSSAVGSLKSPDTARRKRNGIVTNPNYSKGGNIVSINGYFNKLANLPDSMENYPVSSNGNAQAPSPPERQQNGGSLGSHKPRAVRPNGLPIKKETPL